jgi:signal transduction histidine kinase
MTGLYPGFDGAGSVPAATTPGLADRLDALLDAGRRLASTSSSEALNEAVQDAIVALLRPEWCGVAPVNVDGYLTPGEDPDPMWRRLQALVAQALDARRAVVLRDGAGSVAGDRLPIGGVRSALAAPVLAGGRPVAVVLATHSLADLFGETEERLAGFVVALAGAARERDLVQRAVRGEVIAAQEAERTRVARDLHDEVGQSLTSVILTLRLLEASLEATPGDMHGPLTRVAEVRDLANDTLRQVRRLVFELRPPALDDLGLVAAVRRLVGEITYRHAVAVDLVTAGLDDAPRFRPEVETTVYRVIQEALTNMVRHSGTDAGSVILAYGPDGLRAVVEDEGVGFHPELTTLASFGLRGMAERAELVGGALRITSAPGSGTAVVLEVPLA